MKFPKYTPNPLLKDLPDYVKDSANFDKIQTQLYASLQSPHSHAEVIDWHKCFDCMQRVADHKNMMIKFGFKTPAMYLEWKKVMSVIKRRVPLIQK